MNDELEPVMHIAVTGSMYRSATGPESGPSVVGKRGEEVFVTDELRRRNSDRHGRCVLLDLLDDEPAQLRRWGQVRYRRGRFPDDELLTEPGSHEHSQAA